MNATALMYAIGSIGLFSTRAFLPAFLVALLLRFGSSVPWLASLGIFGGDSGAPGWLTHDVTLVVLGILALCEVIATKVPELRRLLEGIDPYVKPGMAILTALGVLTISDAAFAATALGAGGMAVVSLPAGVGTFVVGTTRSQLLGILSAVDEDDSLGLQRLWSWIEDFGVLAGVLAIFILPVLVLILVGLGTAVLFAARAAARRWDESRKDPCGSCGTLQYREALRCSLCRRDLPAAAADGDTGEHQLALLQRRRCPSCAAHQRGSASSACRICRTSLFDRERGERYLEDIDGRLWPTLWICGLFGLVPILGGVAGILLYRIRLVGPLRMWVPGGRSALLRLGLSLVQFLLLTFQWVPVLGGLVIPAMAWLAFRFYRPAAGVALGASARDGDPCPVPEAAT